ncbi:MAG: hypothetical protein QCI00_04355 [Candidatus Thermoplasmatota archaeon]|nr:hypothetical protein [Candidatus Thermoplasmatota archaeon]
MEMKTTNIWIWLQNGQLFKSISNSEDGTVCIYDANDQLILKRTGLTKLQVKQIEKYIQLYGAKKLNKNAEPFRFLGK